MIHDVHALGKATPLSLTAGARGTWTLSIVVDGQRHEFTGKQLSVAGWEYKVDHGDDGATASGTLAQYG